MIYLILKIINPVIRVGVSNLKDEIYKATIAKFVNNVNDLLDDMYSAYYIIIDKGERHDYYVCHIFRTLLSGTSSTYNSFIGSTKGNWDTGTEVPVV